MTRQKYRFRETCPICPLRSSCGESTFPRPFATAPWPPSGTDSARRPRHVKILTGWPAPPRAAERARVALVLSKGARAERANAVSVLSRGLGGENRRVRRKQADLVVGRCHRCPLTPPRFVTAWRPRVQHGHVTRLQCDGQEQPNRLHLSPLDGLVPTRRTCMSMPGAKSVVAFAGTRVLDGKPHHNSQIWLKGTFTG
jgi:hypothetical protein